jgi:hypothetical protein
VVRFADNPDVDNALSPDAVVEGVVPEVTTAPTIESPVAGALLSILRVTADIEFHVPAKYNDWYFVKLFEFVELFIGDAE